MGYTKGTCIPQSLFFKVSRNTDGIICNSVPEIDGDSLKRISGVVGVQTFGIGSAILRAGWVARLMMGG
jgi:hypothetical protein